VKENLDCQLKDHSNAEFHSSDQSLGEAIANLLLHHPIIDEMNKYKPL